MKTKDAIHQLEQNIQKLGIIDIQAYDGELSLDIVQGALNSTQKLLNSLDLDTIAADIVQKM